MGGTPAAASSTLGQFSVDNMGGTPATDAGAGQGQFDADNMGGTPQAPSQDDGDGTINPKGPTPR